MQRRCIEICCDLAKTPLAEILPRDLLYRSCTEILPGHLFCRPCAETVHGLHGDLLQRSCQEVSYIHFAKRAFIDSLYRDLGRSCRQISYSYLGQRSCQETSSRDLCREIFYRDFVQRSCQETSYRPGEEGRGLARRSFRDSLNMVEQRSYFEVPYKDLLWSSPINRHLVQIALRRDLAQELLQGTSQGDLAHDLLQTSSHSAESDLVSLLLTTMFALVLLACRHWLFEVLSTSLFWIPTTHCLGSLVVIIRRTWRSWGTSLSQCSPWESRSVFSGFRPYGENNGICQGYHILGPHFMVHLPLT